MAASSSSTTPPSQASSMAQNQKVDFDSSYKKGIVYVFPPIIEAKPKFFNDTNEKAPQDPVMPPLGKKNAMLKVADQDKMDKAKDKVKGEEAETCVVTMLYEQLQEAASPGDPPAFIFTSLQIEGREKDVIIYHERHGIIIVEIKAIDDIGTAAAPRGGSTLVKAADQLIKAKETVTSELQGLLARQPSLLVALPNLQGTDLQDVRQRVKFFRDNPEVAILCGRAEADYEAWLQQLSTRPDPLVWEAQPDSHQAFVTAVRKHLSVQPFSPTQTAIDLAQLHRTWLLTPDQAPVLHLDDPLLHLWGPPGAGKTILLLHRVRRWLQGGKSVVLCVGYPFHSALLQHLGRTTVSADKAFSLRLTLCRGVSNFFSTVKELGKQVSPDDICVVVDEVDSGFLYYALPAFQRHQISCLWTASVQDISHTQSAQFSTLGGQRVPLQYCIRCPPSVVEVAGKLLQATTLPPAMTAFPCLPARLPTASVKVSLHPSHPHYRALDVNSPHFDCGDCSQWLESSLSPLAEGLPLQDPKWRHWVIVCTGDLLVYSGNTAVKSMLVDWLKSHEIPALWEGKSDMDGSNLPVSSVQGSKVSDEDAERRERMVAGVDSQGLPAVHLVSSNEFLGLEKAGVLVLHYDGRDDHPDCQSDTDRDARKRLHAEQLFHAVTRCQAELAVLLLSPSPALSCLPLSQEEMERWRREELRIREEERRRREEERQRRLQEALERQRREEERQRREEETRRWWQEYKQRQVEEERRRRKEEMEGKGDAV